MPGKPELFLLNKYVKDRRKSVLFRIRYIAAFARDGLETPKYSDRPSESHSVRNEKIPVSENSLPGFSEFMYE